MAPRNTVLRLAVVAGLAVLLSGCYAHGARQHYPYHGGYTYGGAHHAAPGPVYQKHKHRKDGHYKQRRHDRASARDPERSPEGAQRTERRRQARRGSDAQPVQRDRRRAATPEAADDRGRDTAWTPGPTARDEGPRPGAEGGAR